jgi:hypothetical protein
MISSVWNLRLKRARRIEVEINGDSTKTTPRLSGLLVGRWRYVRPRKNSEADSSSDLPIHRFNNDTGLGGATTAAG